ncbi:MAG: translation elongation factor Ts [Pleurocapsa minor GSE-CHR-MK-17-07R]|jgi:elongation factor Ts|nr:translation elongation factor Ts [Pleurocapsa minor GSE-CHR-MK 17-07R]
MAVTAQMVKDLREMTGAGPLDCKKALEANDGDMNKSADYLREKGIAKAAKKLNAGRSMNEGLIESYLHFNKRLGVLVEINCETDFVANTDNFRNFCREIALHIANLKPQVVRREQLPAEQVEAERDLQRRRAIEEGKPEAMAAKIADGRMEKYFQEIVLMEQPWLKDDSKTIQKLLEETVTATGESIEIRRFACFALGEGNSSEAAE